LGSKAKIIGFSPLRSELPVEQTIRNGIEKAAKKLRTKNLISNETIVSVTKFVGQGYAQLTEDAIEAILIIVRLEGTLLDPVYTGKAMAGLLSFLQISRIGTH
jgi:1-aminocyclopropane-1-carboxylate deaminase/D-cysteine desulfhydrase-like pyridoxal-dependent ACC family enzyme